MRQREMALQHREMAVRRRNCSTSFGESTGSYLEFPALVWSIPRMGLLAWVVTTWVGRTHLQLVWSGYSFCASRTEAVYEVWHLCVIHSVYAWRTEAVRVIRHLCAGYSICASHTVTVSA